MEINKYSRNITQNESQPAGQAMLYGIGLTDDDMRKAQVGIASAGYEGNTCNTHLKDLSKDWPKISKKPFDHPFGPYVDPFSEEQHKFGPYKPIKDWYSKN